MSVRCGVSFRPETDLATRQKRPAHQHAGLLGDGARLALLLPGDHRFAIGEVGRQSFWVDVPLLSRLENISLNINILLAPPTGIEPVSRA